MKNLIKFLASIGLVANICSWTVVGCTDNNPWKYFKNTDLGFLENLKEDTVLKAIKEKNPEADTSNIPIFIYSDYAVLKIAYQDSYVYENVEYIFFKFNTKISYLEGDHENKTCKVKNNEDKICQLHLNFDNKVSDEELKSSLQIKFNPNFLSLLKAEKNTHEETFEIELKMKDGLELQNTSDTVFGIYWYDARLVYGTWEQNND